MAKRKKEEVFLTVDQVAGRLNRGPGAVQRYLRRGDFPNSRELGNGEPGWEIPASDVDAFLARDPDWFTRPKPGPKRPDEKRAARPAPAVKQHVARPLPAAVQPPEPAPSPKRVRTRRTPPTQWLTLAEASRRANQHHLHLVAVARKGLLHDKDAEGRVQIPVDDKGRMLFSQRRLDAYLAESIKSPTPIHEPAAIRTVDIKPAKVSRQAALPLEAVEPAPQAAAAAPEKAAASPSPGASPTPVDLSKLRWFVSRLDDGKGNVTRESVDVVIGEPDPAIIGEAHGPGYYTACPMLDDGTDLREQRKEFYVEDEPKVRAMTHDQFSKLQRLLSLPDTEVQNLIVLAHLPKAEVDRLLDLQKYVTGYNAVVMGVERGNSNGAALAASATH